MLYPVSEVENFVTGLNHPESVAVGRDHISILDLEIHGQHLWHHRLLK